MKGELMPELEAPEITEPTNSAKALPAETLAAIQRVRDHVERHKGKERAPFSIAGLRAVLEALDAQQERQP
jgi:hypothetical protein